MIVFENKDREFIIKLIAISICVLELFITLCTFIYQQDEQKHIETPITEEMARPYIEKPEKLKANERIAEDRRYTESGTQKNYLLISEEMIVHPFPWKGWLLLSFGAPITLAFIIVLIAKAYFQIVESGEKNTKEADDGISSKWVRSLNSLSSVNVTWLMLFFIAGVFLFWYIPEVLKFTGGVAVTWLSQYWWIPMIAVAFLGLIVLFKIFLQYRLKLKAMEMDMEFEKFKFLQGDMRIQPAIEDAHGRIAIAPSELSSERVDS